MNLVGAISVVLFLVAATVGIGVINPSFAIFPAFVLFLVGVAFFFRPIQRGKIRRRPAAKAFSRKHNFDGPYSPHGYSRLSSLDEVTRAEATGATVPGSRRDEDIGADVRTRLAADPILRLAGIEAESRFGRVTLIGRVRDETERERAKALAESVTGVSSVSVQIRLQRAAGRTA